MREFEPCVERSLNPTEAYSFFCKMLLEKNGNRQERGRVGQLKILRGNIQRVVGAAIAQWIRLHLLPRVRVPSTTSTL